MTSAAWTNLIDALGTVALVVAGLAYLAWDRFVDAYEVDTYESRQNGKGSDNGCWD